MNEAFVKLAQLFICTEGVTGRKKLQKMVHILQTQGVDFGFDFRLALYGAYSSNLSSQVEELVEFGLINESPSSAGGYPTSNFVAQEKLISTLDTLQESHIPTWSDFAKSLNEKSSRELEGISTVLYLEKAGLAGESLKVQFQAIKPHLSGDFQAARSYVSALSAA